MFMHNQTLATPNFSEATKLKIAVKANTFYKTSLDHLHDQGVRKKVRNTGKEIEVTVEE